LTTIDAGTRVARYILQDILGTYVYAPLKSTSWWPGILLTSVLVTCGWGYLLYSGDVSTIWPLFGVANQLLSIIALAIGTTIILKIAPKKSYAWITFAPLSFLSVTIIVAGIMNVQMFFKRGDALGNTNGTISIFLIVLVIITLLDSIRLWLKLLKTDGPIGMNTEISILSCPVDNNKPNIPS
ncbi:MAG: carbon starvation CstA family protein, partial [Sporomusa sp.]